MALALQGEGPLAQLDLALTLDAGSQRVLTGTTRLRQQPEGLGFAANVHGPIAVLIPPRFRDFFGDETKLARQRHVQGGGRPASAEARPQQRRAQHRIRRGNKRGWLPSRS